ncbi:MAG: AI-2E family transporter [Pseudomonadota bacterium]
MATDLRNTPILFGIAVILAFATLELAQDFFAPLLTALVFGVILSPLSDLFSRVGLRPSLSSLITVSVSLILVACLAFLLEPYIAEAIEKAPVIWFELRGTVDGIRSMISGLNEIAEDVAQAVEPDTAPAPAEAPGVDVPSITDALFYAPQYLAQFMIFIGVLYFFLMTRKEIYHWLGTTVSSVASSDFAYAERQVARYFLTITAINASFGILIAIVMQVFSMPAPVLWGIMAFLLNYILYLGPIALAGTLLVTGLVVFDGPISFAPAAVYLAINATEGQFVTPALVGHQMSVNPLLVFVSLVFWLWLWGPIGGIIAIPLLIWSISITRQAMDQAISSGTPGKLTPKRLAGADA